MGGKADWRVRGLESRRKKSEKKKNVEDVRFLVETSDSRRSGDRLRQTSGKKVPVEIIVVDHIEKTPVEN